MAEVFLPPAYSPGLNPVEGVWAHVKRGLADLAAVALPRPRHPHSGGAGPGARPTRPTRRAATGTIHSVPAAVSRRAASVGSGIGGHFPPTSLIFRLPGAVVEQLDDAVGDIRLGDPGEDPPDRIVVGCGIEIRDRVDGDTDVVAEVECGPGARLDAGAGGNPPNTSCVMPRCRSSESSWVPWKAPHRKVGTTRSCSWSANSSMISAKSGPGGSGRSRSCSTRPGAGPPIATRITGSWCR